MSDFRITVHEAPNGDLLLSVDSKTQAALQALKAEKSGLGADFFGADDTRFDVFEWLIANSEFHWVSPEEIGALTDAPILGTKASQDFGDVVRAWAFLDYALRSPQDDLADNGRVRFTSGD